MRANAWSRTTQGIDAYCWHCNTDLILKGKHDVKDSDAWLMVTNLTCPDCNSYVEVYYPEEKSDER